ncbi:MAG: hypothetical protein NTY04_02595, partial [Candidatus Staskawiczbacteria bacterium]|nr:hypothetical protein [Candidatus Staskawiczbacteria bacterium]
NNPGTASSTCTNATNAQLQTTCTGNQTCTNGSCVSVNIACSSNSQCGTNGPTGGLFCQGNNVYQNYITYTCNNPGTASSTCTNATNAQLQTTCTGNQTCTNGSCTNSCTSNYQQRCSGNNLYWYDSCGNQQSLIQWCQNGCYNNYCQNNYINTCTYHSYLRCSGNNLYWYDSCGVQQDLSQYCPNGCSNNACQNNVVGTLTVSKTVKNLTSGSAFLTSTSANPSDMLMFMITLQASGSDVQNVVVRDTLPANLTYSNQLIVARSNNSYNNYSGDVISGLNLNTISAGQTVTVTYQAQVALAPNFTYGSTTLTNPTNTTSSSTSYVPQTSASVIVTTARVLGASTVSTGLTNNFWVDSFFLPLLITIIFIWMWRGGIFFGVEKWFDNKKKIARGYKAEKELAKRIQKLRG